MMLTGLFPFHDDCLLLTYLLIAASGLPGAVYDVFRLKLNVLVVE